MQLSIIFKNYFKNNLKKINFEWKKNNKKLFPLWNLWCRPILSGKLPNDELSPSYEVYGRWTDYGWNMDECRITKVIQTQSGRDYHADCCEIQSFTVAIAHIPTLPPFRKLEASERERERERTPTDRHGGLHRDALRGAPAAHQRPRGRHGLRLIAEWRGGNAALQWGLALSGTVRQLRAAVQTAGLQAKCRRRGHCHFWDADQSRARAHWYTRKVSVVCPSRYWQHFENSLWFDAFYDAISRIYWGWEVESWIRHHQEISCSRIIVFRLSCI